MKTGLSRRVSRRQLIKYGVGAAGVVAMPYLSRAADRPAVTHGVQSGDVGADGGVVWARADRPSQMLVEVSTTESFKDARALPPIAALPESDFTAKMLLENLPSGQDIFYRVRFRDLSHIDIVGEPTRLLPSLAAHPNLVAAIRYILIGLALLLVLRFRPQGMLPERRPSARKLLATGRGRQRRETRAKVAR